MDGEKKEEKLLDVDGIEDWMTQFIIDPFHDGNADGIRMELFETDSAFIIEVIVPGYHRHDIVIKVVQDGIHMSFLNGNTEIRRFVNLPFSLCNKRITASIEHNILEIMIHKKKNRLSHSMSRHIKIREGRNR
ncbi:hypothetical protein FZW96_08680 [Bacillus sp. BGMRC 2118]|nr:hypothetical protein FZW96_08680 [Bacillus sp. BGMRC 2118]